MPNNKTVLSVKTASGSYPITVGRGTLADVGSIFSLSRRVLIVTDDGVPTAYAEAVAACAARPVTVTIRAGEQSKSLSSLEHLCRTMLENGFTRDDCVVAVGGGVVGDLAGFAASVYMRGIDFYNLPTTLLSQVDSSVGGKVAVDLDTVKNAVGAFYPPRAVLIDPDVLSTLPPRQIASGLAESVKMALTHDAALFSLLEEEDPQEHLEEIIVASLRIKRAVVEADERESGIRRVLNLGHTVGHGIESLLGIDASAACDVRETGLYHGECVALGMLPMCSNDVRVRLIPLLKKLSLPTHCTVSEEGLLAAMTHDKKATSDGTYAVFVDEVGTFRIEKTSLEALALRVKATLF